MLLSRSREHGCPVCGARAVRGQLIRADGRRVLVCVCGSGALAELPSESEIRRLYRDHYHRVSDPCHRERQVRRRAFGAGAFTTQLLDALPKSVRLSSGPWLDVGSGDGALLSALRARGIRATGIEPDLSAVQFCRGRLRLSVSEGTAEELSSREPHARCFDVVSLVEVLEHVPDPVALVREVRKFLGPGGRLLLTTPNFGMARHWGRRYVGLSRSFEHLLYLEHRGLRRVLRRAGLEVEFLGRFNPLWTVARDGDPGWRRQLRRCLKPAVRLLPRDVSCCSLLAVARVPVSVSAS